MKKSIHTLGLPITIFAQFANIAATNRRHARLRGNGEANRQQCRQQDR
jgi:hypothetical protein